MPSEVRQQALEAAFRATGQLLCWCDPHGGALAVDGAVETLTGRSEAAFSRFEDLLDAVHEEDRAPLAERCGKAAETRGQEGELHLRLVHPDGTVIACEVSVTRFDEAANGSGGALRESPDLARGGRTTLAPGLVLLIRALPANVKHESHRLASLIEYLPDYVSIHSTDGYCLSMNAAGRRLLGIGRDEDVRRLGLVDIVADSTSAPAHLLMPVVLSHGSHSTDVVMIDRRNGNRIPAAWSASLVSDGSPAARYIVCIARDMSEELEIEWELRQNQRRLTHALDVSQLGEWSMDVRMQTSPQSRRVMEIFGYRDASEPWSYRLFLNHVHPDDRERVERAFSRALETGRDLDFEARITRRDGELRWISAKGSLNRGLAGEGRHIGGVIQDITTRKFAEQRDRFLADVSVPLNTLVDNRRMLEQVTRLVVPFLADHCSVDLSTGDDALERVAATSSLLSSEAVGRAPREGRGGRDGSAEGSRLPAMLRHMLHTHQTLIVEVSEPARLDGIARTRAERLSLQALDVRSYMGVPLVLRQRRIGVLNFYRVDLGTRYTDKDRQVAQELATRVAVALENARLYQALQDSDHRKDEFLAMLSHELRNPLESLSVGIALLESKPEERLRDWAQTMIRGQIERLSDILEDLLDVSRYTFNKVVLQRRRAELGPLLEQLVEEMREQAEERGYRVVLDALATPLHVDIDTTRFGQVVSNLLTNAVKYGGERGEIRLSVARENGTAVITVSDQGVGIAADELPKVFELFSQGDTTIDRSRGGLGMGLTLVRRIIEMHDGSVAAHSDGVGRGSRFVVTLPLSTAPPACAEATTVSQDASRTGSGDGGDEEPRPSERAARTPARPAARGGTAQRRLLLVDDNIETVTALQKLFGMKGYEVRTANDGLSALSLAEAFEPHAAVLDIGLPGASGYEVASTLRERYGERPLLLVALSGYGQQKDRDRSREAGFDHHLLKPASFRSLIDLLEPE